MSTLYPKKFWGCVCVLLFFISQLCLFVSLVTADTVMEDCLSRPSCSACLAAPTCGWCASTNICVAGTGHGVDVQFASCPSVYYIHSLSLNHSICPMQCQLALDCLTCIELRTKYHQTCGWCALTTSCQAGDEQGTFIMEKATCPLDKWTITAQKCQAVERIHSIELEREKEKRVQQIHTTSLKVQKLQQTIHGSQVQPSTTSSESATAPSGEVAESQSSQTYRKRYQLLLTLFPTFTQLPELSPFFKTSALFCVLFFFFSLNIIRIFWSHRLRIQPRYGEARIQQQMYVAHLMETHFTSMQELEQTRIDRNLRIMQKNYEKRQQWWAGDIMIITLRVADILLLLLFLLLLSLDSWALHPSITFGLISASYPSPSLSWFDSYPTISYWDVDCAALDAFHWTCSFFQAVVCAYIFLVLMSIGLLVLSIAISYRRSLHKLPIPPSIWTYHVLLCILFVCLPVCVLSGIIALGKSSPALGDHITIGWSFYGILFLIFPLAMLLCICYRKVVQLTDYAPPGEEIYEQRPIKTRNKVSSASRSSTRRKDANSHQHQHHHQHHHHHHHSHHPQRHEEDDYVEMNRYVKPEDRHHSTQHTTANGVLPAPPQSYLSDDL